MLAIAESRRTAAKAALRRPSGRAMTGVRRGCEGVGWIGSGGAAAVIRGTSAGGGSVMARGGGARRAHSG